MTPHWSHTAARPACPVNNTWSMIRGQRHHPAVVVPNQHTDVIITRDRGWPINSTQLTMQLFASVALYLQLTHAVARTRRYTDLPKFYIIQLFCRVNFHYVICLEGYTLGLVSSWYEFTAVFLIFSECICFLIGLVCFLVATNVQINEIRQISLKFR